LCGKTRTVVPYIIVTNGRFTRYELSRSRGILMYVALPRLVTLQNRANYCLEIKIILSRCVSCESYAA